MDDEIKWMTGGFTVRQIAGTSYEEAAKWDPVRDVYRGNCVCGKWLVIPKGFTESNPLICGGPCGSQKKCGRRYYWKESRLQIDQAMEEPVFDRSRPSFESIYMDLAHSLSRRSTCSRLQVGAVVVTPDFSRVLALGYNGGPRGGANGCLSENPGECGHLHAEINALLKMDYNDPIQKIMLVTRSPCYLCSVAIVNAGIAEVVYDKEYRLTDGIDLLTKSGVKVRKGTGDVPV
jgi:dCMP deaminase